MSKKKIDLLAHERHFFDHLLPMFMGMPAEYRGSIITRQALAGHVSHLLDGADVPVRTYATRANLTQMLRGKGRMFLCSASGDLATIFKAGGRAVFTQHGAGQSFIKKSPSYAGWPHHKNVAMFLHPGPSPAAKDAELYGQECVRIVGSPKMDKWHTGEYEHEAHPNGLPNVIFSTHWNCGFVPETKSAFWHMLPGLEALAQLNGKEFNLYGHGHPRILDKIRPEYKKRGIEVITRFQDVLQVGDLYVMDHMSTLYEFASAGPGGEGRPVVVMNCPEFRRKVNHGLRFWDAAGVGINVWEPSGLVDAVRKGLQDPEEVRRDRKKALAMVYAYMDGRASQRAADAIVEALDREPGRTVISQPRKRRRTRQMPQKSYFNRNQVAMRALVRLRNSRRGYTIKHGRPVEGIDAMRGRMFFTDSDHARELEAQMAATILPDVEFPGSPKQAEQVEVLTESDAPEVLINPQGGGYYEVVEDGEVVARIRGKKQAEATREEILKKWREQNLPQD